VVSWDRRNFGFARADADGGCIFLGSTELTKSGIKKLEPGDRVSFQVRADDFGKTRRAVNVRVLL
jgi:cold shock CspA family protein